MEISWKAPQFEKIERTANWYLYSMGATVLFVLIALFQKNLLFAIFVILAEIVIIFLGKENSKYYVYVADQHGIYVNDRLLKGYGDLSAFAFHDMGSRYVELVLRPSKRFHTFTRLFVPRERMEDLAEFLGQRLEAFEYEGGIADVVAKHIGL